MTRGLWALGFAVAFLYTFPYFHQLRSANEVPRVILTREIVDRGSFSLDGRWAEASRGSTFDIATTPDGRHYSNKAPGASFAAVPAYLALRAGHAVFGGGIGEKEATWAFRVTASTLPVLLFLPFFLRVARHFAREPAARAALVALAFGSMLYPYALVFYSHALSAACAGGAFACAVALARGTTRRPGLAAVGCGLLAGSAVLVDYQAALAALAVGVYLLVRAPRRALLATAGALPPAALLGFYHTVCFGAPWRTGYSFAVDVAHKQGVLGIVGPNREAMAQAFITPDNGLLLLSPWVLLSVVGAVALLRRPGWRAEAAVGVAVVVAYALFIGSLVPEFGRAGWSVGPRYIAVAMPFFAWLAAAGLDALDDRPSLRAVAHTLLLVGVVVMVVAATTFPHWPTSFTNPLYEVSVRALTSGLAPHSLGTLVGLRGIPSLVPLYTLIAVLVVFLLAGRDRKRLATTCVAALCAAWIVWGYAYFPRRATPDRWGYVERVWEPR